MTDERDICERLKDANYDGALSMLQEAERVIKALRYYVAQLEDDIAELESDLEEAQEYSSKQALDIVTLGQEVGRLMAELENITKVPRSEAAYGIIQCLVRAALAEKETK